MDTATPSAPLEGNASASVRRARGGMLRDSVVTVGRLAFVVGLAAFGVQHVVFGEFVTGRAPTWPEETPGRMLWATATGALLIAAGASLATGRAPRLAATVAGALIFGWALLRQLPLVAADAFIGGEWTRAGKAVVLLGGLAVAIATRPTSSIARRELLRWAGRLALGGFMIQAGVQHFKWDAFVITLVPAWVPGGGAFWTYASGVLLILGGAGLLVPRTSRLAAALSGLMIFLWVPMLHLPRAFASSTHNEWTAVFEALAFSGIAFMLAGPQSRGARSASVAP